MLGADHVIDYTREDFTRSGRRYDELDEVADALRYLGEGHAQGKLVISV